MNTTLEQPAMPAVGTNFNAAYLASWFTYFTVCIEQSAVSIKDGSVLTQRQTADGTEIGIDLPVGTFNAKVTSVVGLASADGLTLGSGYVTLHTEVVSGETCILKPTQHNVKIYFGAPAGGSTTAIAPGLWIMVTRMASGIYQTVTGYC